MSYTKKDNFETNDDVQEEHNGFVPVQYKILKLEADYIISCPKKQMPKEKGTGTIEYYDVPAYELKDWLTINHGNNGLISVSDDILFQKIRELKAAENDEVTEETPNEKQKKAYKKLQEYRNKIKYLKRKINGNPTDKRIQDVIDTMLEMEEFLFVPEVINVHSKKGIYDKFAKKGFLYGGELYIRRSAGSGNLKQNTVTFIRADIEKKLLKKIRVGFQIDISKTEVLAPSKFGAYEGLLTSGCTFVSKPRVVVVPDFEYITFKDKDNKEHNVYYVTKDSSTTPPEYNIDIVPFFETKKDNEGNPCAYLNSFDGMGLISPDFIEEKWKKDLDIDYIPSAFIVRSIGVKGLLATFPFKEFARRKGYTHIVDVRYKNCSEEEIRYVDINDVDIILTESQWKYKKLYADNSGKVGNNFDYYNDNPEAIWGVQRYAPKTDKDIAKLNYQLEHTSNIQSDDDIQKLIEPTEKYLKLLAEGKPEYVMYALLKEVILQNEDKEMEQSDEDMEMDSDIKNPDELKTTTLNKAIFKNYELLDDAYVSGQIKQMITGILNKAKCGKLYPEHNSNYQFMISDPYGLAQWAFNWYDLQKYGTHGIEDKSIEHIPHSPQEEILGGIGLIPANHIYSKYWMNKNISTVDACRSPMTDIAEHNILTVCNKENIASDVYSEMEIYYRYITSGIIYSLHDLSVIRHSDSDFDGDIVLTTDSDVLIDKAWNVMPTTYDKGVDNMIPQKYDSKVAVESDKQGFGNKVGVYSNLSTSLFAMMPLFADGDKHTDKNYPEYDCTEKQLELYKTIKKDRFIIGEEIDSTKTGVKPELSSDFIFTNHNTSIDEIRCMNQEEIQNFAKKFQKKNEIVPKYMPYFFIYNRESYKNQYNEYKSKMNDICKWYTFDSIDNFVNDMMHGIRKPETKNEKFFWEYFSSHCPLLLTDCLMNKICWKLEMFENELNSIIKEKWADKNKYVLMGYANEEIIVTPKQDKFIKQKYHEYIDEIKKIFNKKNTNNGDGKLYQVGKRDALIYKLRDELIQTLGVGFNNLFHMMVKSLKTLGKSKYNSINSFIWNIMGDDILDVIPLNEKYLKWDDTKSYDEEPGVEILGKNVVFKWEER
ncbi:MAG: RNA dependent RNA polymerase [Lachnospiraceae bacterium]|nr:RNA dependent RNA polymerase [Lachnospiraceae bacterium]